MQRNRFYNGIVSEIKLLTVIHFMHLCLERPSVYLYMCTAYDSKNEALLPFCHCFDVMISQDILTFAMKTRNAIMISCNTLQSRRFCVACEA